MGVTTVALIDTDSDPDTVDLPIPGNDDSIRSIEVVLQKMADAVLEGRAALPPEPVELPMTTFSVVFAYMLITSLSEAAMTAAWYNAACLAIVGVVFLAFAQWVFSRLDDKIPDRLV